MPRLQQLDYNAEKQLEKHADPPLFQVGENFPAG
jgi:hypothetical protein